MGHHKLTLEQKKKAVEIASQGGDQLEYLRKCGAKNPSAAWFYIKKTLEVKETEKKAEPAEKPQLAEVVDKVPEAPVVRPLTKEEKKKIEDQNKPILAEVADKVPAVETIKPAVDMSSKADVSILSAACKGFIFTNLSGGILIEKPERGQSLTIEKEEFGILMDALPKVAEIFKGGQ